MKHRMIITLLLSLLAVAAVVVWRMAPRLFPAEASDLYRRYEHCEHIRVADIRDFQVNDTLTVDVTILQADGDSAWVILQKDFNLPVIPKEYEHLFYDDSHSVVTKYIPRGHPEQEMDSTVTTFDVAIISFSKHTISVFETSSISQREAIIHKQIKIKKQQK